MVLSDFFRIFTSKLLYIKNKKQTSEHCKIRIYSLKCIYFDKTCIGFGGFFLNWILYDFYCFKVRSWGRQGREKQRKTLMIQKMWMEYMWVELWYFKSNRVGYKVMHLYSWFIWEGENPTKPNHHCFWTLRLHPKKKAKIMFPFFPANSSYYLKVFR